MMKINTKKVLIAILIFIAAYLIISTCVLLYDTVSYCLSDYCAEKSISVQESCQNNCWNNFFEAHLRIDFVFGIEAIILLIILLLLTKKYSNAVEQGYRLGLALLVPLIPLVLYIPISMGRGGELFLFIPLGLLIIMSFFGGRLLKSSSLIVTAISSYSFLIIIPLIFYISLISIFFIANLFQGFVEAGITSTTGDNDEIFIFTFVFFITWLIEFAIFITTYYIIGFNIKKIWSKGTYGKLGSILLIIILISIFIISFFLLLKYEGRPSPGRIRWANNSERWSEVNSLASAAAQYVIDNGGELPLCNATGEIPFSPTWICSSCNEDGQNGKKCDLEDQLIEQGYLYGIAVDPDIVDENHSGYRIWQENNGSICIDAPYASEDQEIIVCR